jgi:hypothetical protein
VTIWVGQVEEPLAPFGIPWGRVRTVPGRDHTRMKGINVGMVEDDASPPGPIPLGGRPHVSDDNPYSEAQFKTLKYRPDFPDRFGSIEDARAHCQQFFYWYNHEHRHGGIGLMAPAAVHNGTAAALTEQRAITLKAAFAANPIRFKRLAPKPPVLPTAAWINPPKKEATPTSIKPACSLN